MTKREALAEARRRWGQATAYFVGRPRWYVVGETSSGTLRPRVKYGSGKTWQAAFADADRREKGQPIPCDCDPTCAECDEPNHVPHEH